MFNRSRRFGPPWAQREWDGPRDPRSFGPGGPHTHHHHGGWQRPSPEQQALRSTAAEVARLFWIASQKSDDPEQLARLRALLESARTDLSDIIYGTSKEQTTTATPPDVSQA